METIYLYLYLPIKQKYLDLIDAGIKKEEYRDFDGNYWTRRLHKLNKKYFELKEQGKNVVRIARFHSYRRIYQEFVIKDVRVGKGKPEWGAEPNKDYIIIDLGDSAKPT